LEETFHITGRKSEKGNILMVFPKSWSVRTIQQEFKASTYMVQTAEKLVAEKRIWHCPASCNR
jgi:hypothetical protein